ncbi:MAG: hypothetical protein OIN66_16350 [Candidatus Methanoperedens sp.]|nr:hypothetical protein [Candidatus Methanoperedens sp.]
MKKITAVIFALALLPGIQLASGIGAQVINDSDATPTVNETLTQKTVITGINISSPQVTAYVQQKSTISISGANITTAGNQVIVNGNTSIVRSQTGMNGNISIAKKDDNQKAPTINPSGVFIAHTEESPQTNKSPKTDKSPKISKSPGINKSPTTEAIKENEEKAVPGITEIEPQNIKETDINLVLISDSTGVFVRAEDTKNEIALPDSIAEEVKNSSRKNVELKFVEQQPVLNINVTKEGRILGIFPASMDVEIQVDAGSKEIKSVKKPWWNALFVQ